MSFDMEYYQKINNMYGSKSKKDVQLYHLKNQINNRFADTIDCYEVGINNGVMELLIIRTKNDYIKSIKARPFDDFNVGDYINWESNEWMVTSKDEGNQVYTTGKMQLCNWTLKWQDETGAILSYPCVTSSKSFGEDADKVITLPSNQKYILLPFNEYTSKLKADKRFFVDRKNPPTPYHIIGDTDTTSYIGLIQVLVEADVLHDTDNIELGICDYVKPTLPPINPDPGVSDIIVTITSSDIKNNEIKLKLIHSFTAEFKNESGVLIEETNPKYTLDNNYNGNVVMTDKGNGVCTIQINENAYDLIGNSITLSCMDMYSGFSSSITLTIVGLW